LKYKHLNIFVLKIQRLKGILLFCIILSSRGIVHAQDTLKMTLQDCEKQFLSNNLRLLSEKYNIDIARAQVLQSRLYNNPNIQLSGALYNPVEKKYLDISNETGQYNIAVQQLIILAGKRNKQIKLAEISREEAENSFYDLLRTLRYTLRVDFYNIYYLQNSLFAYNRQVASLEKLNSAYESLEQKGIVSLKDAVRIKSLLYSLKSEQAALQIQVNDAESELHLLLKDNKQFILPLVESQPQGFDADKYTLISLTDTAYARRADLKLAENKLSYDKQNYSLQRSMQVPDLTIGAEFDKRGSYLENATLINLGIDLPIFNRNQGNIRAAQFTIKQSEANLDLEKLTVENEVQNAYIRYINTDRMIKSFDPAFKDKFEMLLKGVTENFEKKNISLIEFTDFYESYKNNVLQINQLQFQKMQAMETLYFTIGKTLSNN
jgi:outer membrane protein, heavy metal efflux system